MRLRRVTWRSRELDRPAVPDPVCGTCAHLRPDMERISNSGRPLLGRCPYSKHMVLLSEHRTCKNYQLKTERDERE